MLIVVCVMSMAQIYWWCRVEGSEGGCVVESRRAMVLMEE